MSKVGKSEIRVDAFDKVTGRTKYYEDQMPNGALYVRIKHSTIAHGFVKSIDKSAAEAIPGVVKVLTSTEPGNQSRQPPDEVYPAAYPQPQRLDYRAGRKTKGTAIINKAEIY